MPEDARRPASVEDTRLVTPVVPRGATAGGNRILSLVVAALLVAVLAGGYFAMGMPGLGAPEEARAPDRGIDAIEQPVPASPTPPDTPVQRP